VTGFMAELSLVTFNTHYGVRSRRGAGQPYDLAAVLGSLAADVMVIQEVWRPDGQAGVVDEFATEHGYALCHTLTGRATAAKRGPVFAPGGEGTSGTAVLTRVPARLVREVVVGPTAGDPAPARAVPHLEVRVDGHTLQVVGVHLTSRLPHGPPIQLRRLGRALPDPGTPTVVAGDCNFWGPGVLAVLGDGWRRAVTGRTWPAHLPHSQIDHVLVRAGDVHTTDPVIGDDCGSDHRPVRVRVSW
jgi:endonuclease/exonuclease/phosphatase family metal-dependent hydrolase